MSEELVVRLCAPTLAGLKTGSLFSAEYTSEEAIQQELSRLNRILIPKGLHAVSLRFGKSHALIYVYRPSRLKRDLNNREARNILGHLGYDVTAPEQCIRQLAEKIQHAAEFPHEIGLFLSYPPEDVQGFMEHRAADSKCVGCWKVYGDVERAQKVFRQYKRCTEVYCRRWRGGVSIDRLTVASLVTTATYQKPCNIRISARFLVK